MRFGTESAALDTQVHVRIAMRFSVRSRPLAGLTVVMALAAGLLVSAHTEVVSRPLAMVATLDNDIINPITARFLIRAIERAELRQAACLVIVLDTPGGLVDSTRDITRRSSTAPFPWWCT